jgi:hypothetical protein
MTEPWQEDAEKGWNALSFEGEAQWFARKDDKVLGGRLRGLDALIGTVRNAEALSWNLYLNANPTRHVPGRKKLSREDVTHWRYIVVDLDPTELALQPPQPGVSGPLKADYWLKYAHRIFSGRGYQYWLPFEPREVRPVFDSDFGPCTTHYDQMFERVMQGYLRALGLEAAVWCPCWKVDTACSDLGRVVRCPGSVNQRTGRRAVFEHVAQRPWVPLEELLHFEQFVPAAPPPPEHVDFSNLLDLLPHLNACAKAFILEGAEAQGRHRACYATCKTLHELGVPPQKAEEWLMEGARKCWSGSMWREQFDDPLRPTEVHKIMKQVYGI